MVSVCYEDAFSYEDALARAADECGIDREYWDIFHRRHEASSEVRRRILQSLGWDVSSPEALNAQRRTRFLETVSSPAPKTLVVSKSDVAVPVTFGSARPADAWAKLIVEGGAVRNIRIDPNQLEQSAEFRLNDGTWSQYRLRFEDPVPLGYHTLEIYVAGQLASQTNLIVCPDRAYMPDDLARGGRTAGLNVALYGLRSDRNWGCGDFTDLQALADWAYNEVGFTFVGVNPLHALHNRVPYNTSPYLPLSLYYKNLIYIDVERVPEFASCEPARHLVESDAFQKRLRELRNAEFVQYSEVDRLKRRCLNLLFDEFRKQNPDSERSRAFNNFCDREGDLLHNFALYCALDEQMHKQDSNRWIWPQWPEQFRSPHTDASRAFANEHALSVTFYKYVQFVLDEQLRAAQQYALALGMPIGIYHDLAVATDSCGSDLWAYRDFYVNGCRVGAPPDDFSPDGQDWAFPPPNKHAHRDSGYRLYRESISKIVGHGGALRIDHVMRLFRLFWIPDGMRAADGIYVRDEADDLMRILALESVRNRNVIIGEDLGTVTDEIRAILSQFGILSYRLFYFEKHHQTGLFKRLREYPHAALVASSTHDLPTIAGFWSFRDIEARTEAGLIDQSAARNQMEDRRREKQRMLDILHAERLLPSDYTRDANTLNELDGPLHNAIVAFLARVQSVLLLINQEDYTKELLQQNLPGSTEQYPNWQRKMKVRIEDLGTSEWQPYTDMFRHHLSESGRRAATPIAAH